LTDDFENTDAFRSLVADAGNFGFTMPYGRNNQYGNMYEPWQWLLEEVDRLLITA